MRSSTIEAVPVGRFFLRLVDLLPMPSLRVQRIIAAAVILTQGGIAVTGAIVRVTASGLGCPTWPQCFPGSFTPVPVAEVPESKAPCPSWAQLLDRVILVVVILVRGTLSAAAGRELRSTRMPVDFG